MSCHTLLVTAQTGYPFQQITRCQICTEEGVAVNSGNMLTFIPLFSLQLLKLLHNCLYFVPSPQDDCVDSSYVHNIGLVVPMSAMIHLLSHLQKSWIWLTLASV